MFLFLVFLFNFVVNVLFLFKLYKDFVINDFI